MSQDGIPLTSAYRSRLFSPAGEAVQAYKRSPSVGRTISWSVSAAIISSCFKAAVSRQQVSQLTLLDPLTEISNARGFGRDLAREISRARRATKPITALLLEVEDRPGALHEVRLSLG